MKKRYLFIFIILSLPIMVLARIPGDVNNNGRIDSADYILVKKHIMGTKLTGEDLEIADVDGKEGVTSADYIYLRKIIMGTMPTPVVTPTPPAPTPTEVVVSSVQLNATSVRLFNGYGASLSATVSPSDATNKTITWASSNPSVVVVENGVIKGVAEGSATITATASNGVAASCQVNVINYIDHNIQNSAVTSLLSSRDVSSVFKNAGCGQNGVRCDIPNNYVSAITGEINLYSYNLSSHEKSLIKKVSNETINYYMIPGNVYYLESTANPAVFEIVKISGKVRMIDIPDMRNVRDMGGWTADGGVVKYGMIFRGANPDDLKTKTAFNALGIKRIIDIRTSTQINERQANMKVDFKSITKNFPASGYNLDNNNKAGVRAIMEAVVDGKVVYFHCQVGTDRTGTLAYLLEGILGLDKTSRYDDYELSYFYREEGGHGKNRNHEQINKLYDLISKGYSKKNKGQEKFIKWFIAGSSNVNNDIKLINDFRAKMINGSPTKYKISNGALVEK